MKKQICIAVLFLTVLLLPMIPASADEPIIDYSSGNTVFTYSDSATTVELVGEWDWDNPVTLSESSGVWTAEVA